MDIKKKIAEKEEARMEKQVQAMNCTKKSKRKYTRRANKKEDTAEVVADKECFPYNMANAKPVKKAEGRHYDFMKFETIEVIESVVSREGLPRIAAYEIGNAVKYLLRAGLKPGENWTDDVSKAKNYLARALTGKWEAK